MADKNNKSKVKVGVEEKISVYVPIDPLNPNVNYIDVSINGKRIRVKRGVSVEIPKRYAEVLMESLERTSHLDEGSLNEGKLNGTI